MPALSSSRPRPVWPLIALGALLLYAFGQAARFAGGAQRRSGTGAFGEARSTDEPHSLQVARAAQPGRGRKASAPWSIPWQGWKDILWRTYEQINEDRLLAVAAGVVFYGLLALFPSRDRLRVVLWAVRQGGRHRPAPRHAGGPASRWRLRHRAGADHPHRIEGRREARVRLPVRSRAGAVERQCRDESHHRRAQRRLRRDREARLHHAQSHLARLHARCDRRPCSRRSAPWWCSRWSCHGSGLPT